MLTETLAPADLVRFTGKFLNRKLRVLWSGKRLETTKVGSIEKLLCKKIYYGRLDFKSGIHANIDTAKVYMYVDLVIFPTWNVLKSSNWTFINIRNFGNCVILKNFVCVLVGLENLALSSNWSLDINKYPGWHTNVKLWSIL